MNTDTAKRVVTEEELKSLHEMVCDRIFMSGLLYEGVGYAEAHEFAEELVSEILDQVDSLIVRPVQSAQHAIDEDTH